MIAVIQRVLNSNVVIDGKVYSEINKGLLVLLGVKKGDTKETGKHLAAKILDLRIFEDENGKMNLSVKDVQGEILVISQFTLCTDKNKSGNRPSFTFAEESHKANEMYQYFVNELKQNYDTEKIKTGVFAADMKVNLTNDGPVTIILEKE
jgi:D-tyrosyl-tRNA(Tyr) deacylase